jgi:DNA-binding Lrp family transcriptional regulator
MRYTTVIDISEIPQVYGNLSTRILYVHMALKCGYHDTDRDILDVSVRQLAAGAGLTLSACRHALKKLESAGLIKRQGAAYLIRKWLPEQTISARPKTERQQRQIEAAAERRRIEEVRRREEQIERTVREAQWATGTSPYELYLKQLELKAQAGDMEAAETLKRHRQSHAQQQSADESKNGGK